MEVWLGENGRIPNMMEPFEHEKYFSCGHRQLLGVQAPNNVPDFSAKIWYFVYVCYEESAGLPENHYLQRLSGVHMYGDSFLFKVLVPESSSEEANKNEFLHIGSDAFPDVEGGNDTVYMLRKLLDRWC